jgi:hypothetical protein
MFHSQITAKELELLATNKCSGMQTHVYLALRSFTWKSNSCFPSISKISELLGNAYNRTSIHRALKALQDAGLIEIGSRTSKSRFILLARKIAYAAKQAVKEMLPNGSRMSPDGNDKKQRKENYKKNKYKKRTRGRKYQKNLKQKSLTTPRCESSPTEELPLPEKLTIPMKKLFFQSWGGEAVLSPMFRQHQHTKEELIACSDFLTRYAGLKGSGYYDDEVDGKVQNEIYWELQRMAVEEQVDC